MKLKIDEFGETIIKYVLIPLCIIMGVFVYGLIWKEAAMEQLSLYIMVGLHAWVGTVVLFHVFKVIRDELKEDEDE